MTTNPLDEFASCPRTEEQVTAESLLRYETVAAYVHLLDTGVLRRRAFGPDGTRADLHRYNDAVGELVQRVAALFLLRQIRERSSDGWADEVAKSLHAVCEDGAFAELMYGWLVGYGIDPDRVEQVAADQPPGNAAGDAA